MESLNELILNWYPALFMISVGIALAVWMIASRNKIRTDYKQAVELVLYRKYRNGSVSKGKFEKRTKSL